MTIDEVYERDGDMVRRLAFRWTGCWDEAEDVLQETALKLCRYLPAGAHGSGYVRLAALSILKDRLKRPALVAANIDVNMLAAPASDTQDDMAIVELALDQFVSVVCTDEDLALWRASREGLWPSEIVERFGWKRHKCYMRHAAIWRQIETGVRRRLKQIPAWQCASGRVREACIDRLLLALREPAPPLPPEHPRTAYHRAWRARRRLEAQEVA